MIYAIISLDNRQTEYEEIMPGTYGRVAVGLSGGAAKGLAHIGVLKALEEHGLEPDYIAGTSAGALVGGLYCAGVSVSELEGLTASLGKTEFRKLLDFTWAKGSVVAGKEVEAFLQRLVGDIQIEDMKKPFVATAVDIVTGKGYYFTRGSLVDAIRASISIPGVFEPVAANNGYLVDGGVRQNLPLKVLLRFNPDILIGVDVLASDYIDFTWQDASVERPKDGLPVQKGLWERVRDRFSDDEETAPESPGMTFLLSQVFALITRQISDLEIQRTNPDLIINLNIDDVQLWEFWKGRQAGDLGYTQAKQAISRFIHGRRWFTCIKNRMKRIIRRAL